MLTIKILGPKNPHTDRLELFVRTAIKLVNPHCHCYVIRVSEDSEIQAYVDHVPALVINDVVVSEGALPAPQMIVTHLSNAIQEMLMAAIPAEAFAAAAR
jgi:hypothetical protein